MSDSTEPGRDPVQPAAPRRRSTARWFVALFVTLRGRLILLVSFATVPAILFIFLVASRERTAALDRMETEARHLGSLASREHAHQLNGARSLLGRLVSVVPCDGGSASSTSCPNYLPALLSGFPQFANIGIADPRGNVVCSAEPLDHPINLGKNLALERALGSQEVEVGTFVIGPIVGRPVLHLAAAIREPNRAACGVIFVAVELGWLDQLARQANLPADYSLLMVDRDGRILARSGRTEAEGGGPERTIPGLSVVLDRPHGAVLGVGKPASWRYFVATPMEGVPGVFVIAGLPYERVEGAANRAFYRTLLGLVLVTLFAIGSAIFAAEISVLRVLRALTRTVRRFGEGDLSARPPLPGSHGELRELAVSFGTMADALAAREREARQARDRLRALSHRLQMARDEEAGRIARELHDELGQILTGLKMELSRVRRIHAAATDPAAAEQAMAPIIDQIDSAIDSVRRISSELRPPVLDRLGLAAAIEWLVHDFETKSGLTVIYNITDLREPIDALVATTVFRIVQEALTNVARHAEASEVTIDLAGHDEMLELTIHDNGKGIEPAAMGGEHSLGILGMRERVRLVAGTWQIRGQAGKGTTIRVQVPRAPGEPSDQGE